MPVEKVASMKTAEIGDLVKLMRYTVSAVFGLFRGLAGMIRTSGNQHIRRRNSIDRKQQQKNEEKKQALGQRSSGYEYDYSEGQTM